MISGSVQIRQWFFHAILTSAQQHLNHVLFDVDVDVLNEKCVFVRFAQVVYQSFTVFDFEIPAAHGEILQYFHTDSYPFLYSNHTEKKTR